MARYLITNENAEIDFETRDPIGRTLQNCKNLLRCRTGEVPYDRNRGFNGALLHLPLSELQLDLVPELDRCLAWEPDAHVVDGDVTMNEDGEIVVSCVVEIGE